MRIFIQHKVWWLILLAASVLLSIFISMNVMPRHFNLPFTLRLTFTLGVILGNFIVCFVLAGIPYLFFLLIGRKLTMRQFMIIFSVAFGILVLSRIILILAR
jgi:hypothetical protein